MDRTAKIMRLINDPLFAEFEDLQRETSFFNVVGRTYTETWHSAMLGWLLNPNSNHGIGNYGLRRFVMLMVENEDSKAKRKLPVQDLLIAADFSEAEARPNETKPQEVSIKSVASKGNEGGRIDVFIDGIKHNKKKISILIEMKVNARIDQTQCQRYVAYITHQEKKHGVVVFPVFVTPDWNLGDENKILFGSNQWIALKFQDIYDELIVPCLANNKLTDFGKIMLEEYIKVLKYPNAKKENRRMVVTAKERELAHTLQEKYGDVIDALIEILRPEENLNDIVVSPETGVGRKKPPIKIEIEKQVFEARSIPDLYKKVLNYLLDNKHLDNLELPISTGYGRYLIAKEAIHPKGNPFWVPVKVDEFFMEADKSREGGIHDLFRLLERINLNHKNLIENKGE
jgi:hypothetical protein